MKKRVPYIIIFFLLLVTEIFIGAFVNDKLVRPYVGDMLVTVLLCCLVRVAFPERPKLLAVWVFLFSVAVELSQLINIAKLLGAEGTVFQIIIGSSFDPIDIICYFCGCLLFFAAESTVKTRIKKQKQ